MKSDLELADELARKEHFFPLGDKRKRKTPVCFRCQHHLWQHHFKKLKSVNDGLFRTFHKQCAEEEIQENPTLWEQ